MQEEEDLMGSHGLGKRTRRFLPGSPATTTNRVEMIGDSDILPGSIERRRTRRRGDGRREGEANTLEQLLLQKTTRKNFLKACRVKKKKMMIRGESGGIPPGRIIIESRSDRRRRRDEGR